MGVGGGVAVAAPAGGVGRVGVGGTGVGDSTPGVCVVGAGGTVPGVGVRVGVPTGEEVTGAGVGVAVAVGCGRGVGSTNWVGVGGRVAVATGLVDVPESGVRVGKTMGMGGVPTLPPLLNRPMAVTMPATQPKLAMKNSTPTAP